jgi:hypothetical protein
MELKEITFKIGNIEYHVKEDDGRNLPDLVRELVCAKVGVPYYVKHGRPLDVDNIPPYNGPGANLN